MATVTRLRCVFHSEHCFHQKVHPKPLYVLTGPRNDAATMSPGGLGRRAVYAPRPQTFPHGRSTPT